VRYIRKYHESWEEWEIVTEAQVRVSLSSCYSDVDLALETLHETKYARTRNCQIRVIGDEDSSALEIANLLEEEGDKQSADDLRSYVAKGLLTNITRKGTALEFSEDGEVVEVLDDEPN